MDKDCQHNIHFDIYVNNSHSYRHNFYIVRIFHNKKNRQKGLYGDSKGTCHGVHQEDMALIFQINIIHYIRGVEDKNVHFLQIVNVIYFVANKEVHGVMAV